MISGHVARDVSLLLRTKAFNASTFRPIISRLVDRRFGDEGGVRQRAGRSTSGETAPVRCFPCRCADGGRASIRRRPWRRCNATLRTFLRPMVCIRSCQACACIPVVADDVVAGDVGVAGIHAGARRERSRAVRLQHFGTCSKLAPSEYSAPAVFSIRMVRSAFGQVEILRRRARWQRGALHQAFFAVGAAERSRMQHQIVGAQRQRALDFPAKRGDRLLQEHGSCWPGSPGSWRG